MLPALLLLFISVNPLASDDDAARLAAVEKRARSQKPQLSAKQARALVECVEVPPVNETGCALPAKLCPVHEGDDGSSGTRQESLSLLWSGQEESVKALRVWWTATYEPKRAECEPPEAAVGPETPATRKGREKDFARCVARVEKEAKDDAEELQCDVVLMNACRKEAYLTCRSKNLRKGIAPLERLHRFAF